MRLTYGRLVPHALKPARSNARIAAGMLGIAVTEPVLDEAEVLTFVCEGVAAGVTQHVRVDLSEPGAPPGGGDHVIDRASHHLQVWAKPPCIMHQVPVFMPKAFAG